MKRINSYITEKLRITRGKQRIKINSKKELKEHIKSVWVTQNVAKNGLLDLSYIDLGADIKDLSELFKNNNVKILDVTGWDTSNVQLFNECFANMDNVEQIIGVDTWDVSSGINFYKMFYGCSKLNFVGDIKKWKFANNNLKTMAYMFYGCTELELDLTNWNLMKIVENNPELSLYSMYRNSKVTIY